MTNEMIEEDVVVDYHIPVPDLERDGAHEYLRTLVLGKDVLYMPILLHLEGGTCKYDCA